MSSLDNHRTTRRRFESRGILCGIVVWMLALALFSVSRAEDVVVIRVKRAGAAEQSRRLRGQVTEFRGQDVTLRRNGRDETFPLDQIVQLETTLTPTHLAARQRFDRRDYTAALPLLVDAVDQEPRTWVRRDILAMIIVCRRNMRQWDAACQDFQILLQSDPKTRHLDVMPLAWGGERPEAALATRAEQWLQ